MDKDSTIYDVFPNIPEDEPVILFRAQDKHLSTLLHLYYELCNQPDDRSPTSQLTWILQKRQEVVRWQRENGDKVKVPD